MKTLHLIATRDFFSSAGKHVAGQSVATIKTDMTSGELAAMLRGDGRVVIEVEEAVDEVVVDEVTADNEQPADNEATVDEVDSRPLGDLIESRPASLFAALTPPVTTVVELAAWIADGNRPSDLNGIGDTTESEVLTATGLTLPE